MDFFNESIPSSSDTRRFRLDRRPRSPDGNHMRPTIAYALFSLLIFTFFFFVFSVFKSLKKYKVKNIYYICIEMKMSGFLELKIYI